MTVDDAALDVRVQAADFDLGAEYTALRARAPGAGAITSFCGCVRDLAEGAGRVTEVATLELEHYPGVTEASVRSVAAEACERWPIDALTVIHRVGRLGPSNQIVLVLVASAHRQAAFDANRFVMDYLKTRAVFWKKEHRSDGAYWIESRDDDHRAAEAWARES
ncbi:MAG: molybdenum cofactor biosynthesis protein MoaE [Pseudomonadales bacterium]|jgi:molybdopterin synthase catalytic subunit|nr:molybdenum cofactor biosynthesis protein MoaE [Pseudomonadales bacterium]